MTDLPRVAISVRENGSFQVLSDPGVDVIVVCDFTPEDRLFRPAHMPIPEGMLDGPVGFPGDGSAEEAKVTKFAREMRGEPAFDVIEKETKT